MQEVQQLNSVFVEDYLPRDKILAAVASAFGVPSTNIFFENADTSSWNDEPYHAFIYRITASDVSWRLDIEAPKETNIDEALTILSKRLGSVVLYDELAEAYRDDVVAFDGSGQRAPALLRYSDDDDEVTYEFTSRPSFSRPN